MLWSWCGPFVLIFMHFCLSQPARPTKKISCGPAWIYFSPSHCEGHLRAKLKISACILKQVDQRVLKKANQQCATNN